MSPDEAAAMGAAAQAGRLVAGEDGTFNHSYKKSKVKMHKEVPALTHLPCASFTLALALVGSAGSNGDSEPVVAVPEGPPHFTSLSPSTSLSCTHTCIDTHNTQRTKEKRTHLTERLTLHRISFWLYFWFSGSSGAVLPLEQTLVLPACTVSPEGDLTLDLLELVPEAPPRGLTSLTLPDLSPGGALALEVCVAMDSEGGLTVTARDGESGKEATLSLTAAPADPADLPPPPPGAAAMASEE